MPGRVLILGSVVIAALLEISVSQQPPATQPSTCAIAITNPVDGTPVRSVGTVEGTAQIPTNGHLWILAHKKRINGWWPQSGGETPIEKGRWAVDVTYGVNGDKGPFEVAAVAVDDNGNNDLNGWVQTAPDKNYPSIKFPGGKEGCPIPKVTVEKQ